MMNPSEAGPPPTIKRSTFLVLLTVVPAVDSSLFLSLSFSFLDYCYYNSFVCGRLV